MVSFTVSHVVCRVDHEVCCVDVVPLHCRLEQLRVVHRSVLLEVQLLILPSRYAYVHVHTEKLEVLYLYVQIVVQLTLFREEISLVPVVESHFVLCERFDFVVLEPVSVLVISYGLRFNFEDTATPEEIQSLGKPFEVGEVPDSGDSQTETAVEAHAGDIPDHIEGIEDVVEDGEGDEGLILVRGELHRM